MHPLHKTFQEGIACEKAYRTDSRVLSVLSFAACGAGDAEIPREISRGGGIITAKNGMCSNTEKL